MSLALEAERATLQRAMDVQKSAVERNCLGQFATPYPLAEAMMQFARQQLQHREKQAVRFLDPALGTGVFFSAMLNTFGDNAIKAAVGYEIDPSVASAADKLWRTRGLRVEPADFTMAAAPEREADRYDLIVCNPPYVRHHHLSSETKHLLKDQVRRSTGITLNGLTGLYGYFLCLAHHWLAEGGLAGWLIPAEWTDVAYGARIKDYLLSKVELLRIHRFEPEQVQFDDALVSSAVVWLRKMPAERTTQVEISYGGSLAKPTFAEIVSVDQLSKSQKWSRFPSRQPNLSSPLSEKPQPDNSRLGDWFEIKRGIATGANDFFIVSREDADRYNLPKQFLLPILPSPRYLPENEVTADRAGNPALPQQQFLIACDLPPEQVKRDFPALWDYLQKGVSQGIDQRYLSRHRPVWYMQEKRQPAPILCTYMGRERDGKSSIRFILNHSRAVAPNVYLNLYPKPRLAQLRTSQEDLIRSVWEILNRIPIASVLNEGRVYGGGLHKIEPKELANVPIELHIEGVSTGETNTLQLELPF